MFEFITNSIAGFSLLPSYLVVITIFLVIIPTIITILLRFAIFLHLSSLLSKVRKLLKGETLNKSPKIINYLEARMQRGGGQKEKMNTPALIASSYSQEKFSFFGIPLDCESVEEFTRNLPNLLLAFGLFGTFLGITINLANLSQTLTQAELNDVGSLIQELDQPLQGMGIAFVTSLVAVFFSALLTVINFIWNTNIVKISLLNSLEDYLDNVYWLSITPVSIESQEETLNKLVNELRRFVNVFPTEFSSTLEQVLEKSIIQPVREITLENQKISQNTEQVYLELRESSLKMAKSSDKFGEAVNILEESRFAEKLSTAVGDLAIAQNQFSQSALILNQSTKSLEDNLELRQKSILKIIRLTEEMTSINEKYNLILNLKQAGNDLK